MKAAFTVWNDRIAPLFDVARQVHIVESDGGQIVNEHRVALDTDVPAFKARRLAEMGVATLVCGAISRSVKSMVAAYGIELVPYINGDLETVIDAWQRDALGGTLFRMPGCRRQGGRRSSMTPSTSQGGNTMGVKGRGGKGQGTSGGSGRGQGRGGGARGQGGGGRSGATTADAQGVCICTQCGHQEPHRRGVPCYSRVCAKCGSEMTRQ